MTPTPKNRAQPLGRGFGAAFALAMVLAALMPAVADARDPIDLRLRQINRLLAQHPSVSEVIGPRMGLLSVEGRFLVVEQHTPEWRGQTYELKSVAPLVDLDPAVYVFMDPTIPCRRDPPHRPGSLEGCWRPLWTAAEQGFLLPNTHSLSVEPDEAIQGYIATAIEDLIIMLRAREDALR